MAVFSDRRVQAALEDFIPVAQNCAYTQSHGKDDTHSRFFRKVIQKAEMNERRGITDFTFASMRHGGFTTQGMYTFSPDGTPYGGMNRQNPDNVLTLLAQAKKAHALNPPDAPYILGRFPKVKPEPPPGTLIARSFSRITPLPAGANPRNAYVGRDHLWVLPEEIEALTLGEFPKTLAWRLVRFQFRDNVRGQPQVWKQSDVGRADFAALPTRKGDTVTVAISGDFSLLAPYGREHAQEGFPLPETGYEGTLEGVLVYDWTRDEVLEFGLLAQGLHWGRSKHNPNEPRGKYPLSIAFVLAEDDYAHEIPPAGAAWGEWYLDPR